MIVLADIFRKKVSSNIVRTRHMKHSDVKICDTNFMIFIRYLSMREIVMVKIRGAEK